MVAEEEEAVEEVVFKDALRIVKEIFNNQCSMYNFQV